MPCRIFCASTARMESFKRLPGVKSDKHAESKLMAPKPRNELGVPLSHFATLNETCNVCSNKCRRDTSRKGTLHQNIEQSDFLQHLSETAFPVARSTRKQSSQEQMCSAQCRITLKGPAVSAATCVIQILTINFQRKPNLTSESGQ